MINSEELLFTVDENNQPIKPLSRKVAHATGVWHRTAHVWIYNSQGEVIGHQRSVYKDSSPGLWEAFFGGHISAGIESVQGAVLELQEESGINAAPADLEFIGIRKHDNDKNKEFVYIYLYKWEGRIEDLVLEPEEVDQAAWLYIEDLRNELSNMGARKWTRAAHIYEVVDLLASRV